MSTPIIAREFSFTRDFRSIRWGATVGYNLLRALCAGVVLGTLAYFTPPPGESPLGMAATVLFGMPFMWLFVLLPGGLFFAFLSNFIPVAGIFSFAFGLFWQWVTRWCAS